MSNDAKAKQRNLGGFGNAAAVTRGIPASSGSAHRPCTVVLTLEMLAGLTPLPGTFVQSAGNPWNDGYPN